MNKLYCLLFLWACCLGVQAQTVKPNVTDKRDTSLAAILNAQNTASRTLAYSMAAKKNWPTVIKDTQGRYTVLQGVTELGFPVYFTTHNNATSAATTRTNTVQPGGTLGLNLSGSSTGLLNKLAEWDGGAIYTGHQEFAGKTITLMDNNTILDHSTHVAGTLLATGVYAPAKGMAFNATTLKAYDYNNDNTEMATAAPNLLLSNHSYGFTDGWYFNSLQNYWEWHGLPGDTVDYDFGFYGSYTQSVDQIAYANPQYLVVRSAGNNRGETGPAVGQPYYGYVSSTDGTIVYKGLRPSTISSNNGYDIISSSATGKNVLTVGAVYPLPFGPSTSSDVQIASFSSWGPTDDGRVKPDICGNGVNVVSAGVASSSAYLMMSGTSMASPNVCGSLLLLQEYYAKLHSGTFMRSATLKGLACHTAFDAGNPGPDYIYGWGLLDMQKAAQALTDNGSKSIVNEKTLTQGQTQTFNVVASGNGALVATIAWTDPAATATTAGVINNRTPKLVNDLDIRVSDGTNTFKPWVLDPNNPAANATTGDNIRDNVEQVYVANAVPGRSYTISVSHKNTLNGGSQPYSLIVTGVGGTAYCASAPLSSADSRINSFSLSNISYTAPSGCTSYTDNTNLTIALQQGNTYQLSLTAGTCGTQNNKVAKVYVDWTGAGNFTDAADLVATTPVFAANGSYTSSITVPSTVVPGNYSLLRVVLVETNDASTISPCGTYGKGETQDYRVLFTKSTSDVGVSAIVNPATSNNCPSAAANVTVRIKNYGTSAVSNIPVTVNIVSNSTSVTTTLNETYTGTINVAGDAEFTLNGTFAATAGDTYTITAKTALLLDPVSSNNQLSTTAAINADVATPADLLALPCIDTKTYSLSGTSTNNLFWYKTAADAAPFAYGSPVAASFTPTNNTFYVGQNDYSAVLGPATKNKFTGGSYGQFSPNVYVSTKVPAVIKSARLYVGYPGQVTFYVQNSSGAIVSSVTLNLTATRTTPVSGAAADDVNDQGQVYNLNLALPAAGTYTINTVYDNTVTLFRNNAGVSGYPFTGAGIYNITGNSATNAANTADTTYYKNYYYYFYNMVVQSAGCASVSRTAVPVTTPSILLSGGVLVANVINNVQWYLNGVAIPGATSQIYTPTRSGIYRFDVTTATGCIARSADFSFVRPAKTSYDGSDIALAVFPVPAITQLNIAFNSVASQTLGITLTDLLGQTIYKDSRQITAGPYNTVISTANIADGAYVLRLQIGDRTFTRKISVVK